VAQDKMFSLGIIHEYTCFTGELARSRIQFLLRANAEEFVARLKEAFPQIQGGFELCR